MYYLMRAWCSRKIRQACKALRRGTQTLVANFFLHWCLRRLLTPENLRIPRSATATNPLPGSWTSIGPTRTISCLFYCRSVDGPRRACYVVGGEPRRLFACCIGVRGTRPMTSSPFASASTYQITNNSKYLMLVQCD